MRPSAVTLLAAVFAPRGVMSLRSGNAGAGGRVGCRGPRQGGAGEGARALRAPSGYVECFADAERATCRMPASGGRAARAGAAQGEGMQREYMATKAGRGARDGNPGRRVRSGDGGPCAGTRAAALATCMGMHWQLRKAIKSKAKHANRQQMTNGAMHMLPWRVHACAAAVHSAVPCAVQRRSPWVGVAAPRKSVEQDVWSGHARAACRTDLAVGT